MLLTLDLLLDLASALPEGMPDPVFYPPALGSHAFGLVCFFLAAYAFGIITDRKNSTLALAVIFFSSTPVFTPLYLGLANYGEQGDTAFSRVLVAVACAALIVLLVRPARIVALPLKRFGLLGLLVFSTVWLIPSQYMGEDGGFWYAAETETAEDEKDVYADYRELDAESLMYAQEERLQTHLQKLVPAVQGATDLFFISFASYAYQDVFLKEVLYSQNVLDRRFATKGRSLVLVNHLDTRAQTPLATVTNLARALRYIGGIMNPDEDILMLYLTSHGSRDHELSVDFYPLPLNQLNPDMLRSMLDAAGIRWRVIIISACYSGGFIEALKSPYTVVATAAAADKTSFGCTNESDFTYFGEAVFKQQMNHEFSLLRAFRQAATAIEKREHQENLEPSEPQLFVGAKISNKLDGLSEHLAQRACAQPPSCRSGTSGRRGPGPTTGAAASP